MQIRCGLQEHNAVNVELYAQKDMQAGNDASPETWVAFTLAEEDARQLADWLEGDRANVLSAGELTARGGADWAVLEWSESNVSIRLGDARHIKTVQHEISSTLMLIMGRPADPSEI